MLIDAGVSQRSIVPGLGLKVTQAAGGLVFKSGILLDGLVWRGVMSLFCNPKCVSAKLVLHFGASGPTAGMIQILFPLLHR